MRITSASEVFQAKMEELLAGQGCIMIMDDILIFERTPEEHDERLTKVLKKIEALGLKLNKEKCTVEYSRTLLS